MKPLVHSSLPKTKQFPIQRLFTSPEKPLFQEDPSWRDTTSGTLSPSRFYQQQTLPNSLHVALERVKQRRPPDGAWERVRIAVLGTPFLRLGGALPSVQNGGRRVAGRSDHDILRGSPLASRPQEERGGQARAEQHYLFGKSAYKRPREERKQKAPRSCSAAMGAPGAGTSLRTCCHLHLAQVPHFWTNPPMPTLLTAPPEAAGKLPAPGPEREPQPLPAAGVAHFLSARATGQGPPGAHSTSVFKLVRET